MKRKEFRWDIQGLRAIAVLSVVLFHISPYHLPGGFIGVDVFFVISGYLIMGHIWKDLNNNTFKLSKFYTNRIKRLFPAFFVTIVLTSIFAFIYLLPNEYDGYILSVYYSLLYISNFWFYTKSGYFDTELDSAPLLHTWSLSVEEQFYIIFPILLLFIYKKQKENLAFILIAIFFISLCLSEVLLKYDASLSFYISPTRFWQFITGGFLSIFSIKTSHSKIVRELMAFIGLITLVLCMFFMTSSDFPGLKATIPTFATVLIIFGCSRYDFSYKVLSYPIARFFGNVSYSLYLWHWPVIIFYKLSIDQNLQGFHKIYVLIISITLGYLSYIFIENTTRRIKFQKLFFSPIAISLFATVFLSVTLYASLKYHSHKFTESQITYESYLNYSTKLFRPGECFLTSKHNDISLFDKDTCIEFDDRKENVILIGDSHAAHWYGALKEKTNFDTTLSQVTSSGCRPTIHPFGEKRCSDLIDWTYNELIQELRFDKIILSGRWQKEDAERLNQTINYLKQYSDDIVVLGPIIEYKTSLPRLLILTNSNDEISQQSLYDKILDTDKTLELALSSTVARYVSILNIICQDKEFCITTTKDIPMQFDYGHLTKDGATHLLNKIRL